VLIDSMILLLDFGVYDATETPGIKAETTLIMMAEGTRARRDIIAPAPKFERAYH